VRALSFFYFPSKTDITLASPILNRLQKPSTMPHSPPLQQRLPSPAPANPHQQTPNLPSADQHQAIPRNPESTAPSGAESSPSQLHVSVTETHTPHASATSTFSTLTSSVCVAAALPDHESTPKQPCTSEELFLESPSPEKHVSNGWAKEEANMEAFIASENTQEEMELVPEDPAAAIPEWE
jgi:hypothetical protein